VKRIAFFAVVSGGLVAFLDGSIVDPASWAVVLAVVAGAGLVTGGPKPPIGIEG
jgi:hypothetical protein